FVPLDASLPDERIDLILKDTDPILLITEIALRTKFGVHRQEKVLCLDGISANADDTVVENSALPEAAAYIIYTSGSTGRPKGVQVAHSQLLAFLIAMRTRIGFSAQDRVLVTTAISFDPIMLEILLPLITGASLVVAPKMSTMDGRRLRRLIESECV